MSIITREQKGLPLTHAEMDNNLKVLRDFVDLSASTDLITAKKYVMQDVNLLPLTFDVDGNGKLYSTHTFEDTDEHTLFYIDCEPNTYVSLVNTNGYNFLFLSVEDGVFLTDFNSVPVEFVISGQSATFNCLYPADVFDYHSINVPYRIYLSPYAGNVMFYKNV